LVDRARPPGGFEPAAGAGHPGRPALPSVLVHAAPGGLEERPGAGRLRCLLPRGLLQHGLAQRPYLGSGVNPMAASPGTLQAATVLDELRRCGVTHVVWRPDSETGYMYTAMLESDLTLVPVCREGESIAIAAGLIMGGQRPVVLIQSTGFYESGDSVR